MAALDTSVCAGCCAACDEGSGSTPTTGLGGIGDIAAAVGTGETSGGLGEIADGLKGSGSREDSAAAGEGGGGFGMAIGAVTSGFVARGTAMATGGGRIGLVCVTVI